MQSNNIQSYRDLKVWQRAMELVDEAYEIAAKLPAFERFGLAQQLRRAAVSVAANIAEGHARTHLGEFAHQLSISRGSAAEVEVLLCVVERRHRVPQSELSRARDHCDAIMRMITRLKRRLVPSRHAPRP